METEMQEMQKQTNEQAPNTKLKTAGKKQQKSKPNETKRPTTQPT